MQFWELLCNDIFDYCLFIGVIFLTFWDGIDSYVVPLNSSQSCLFSCSFIWRLYFIFCYFLEVFTQFVSSSLILFPITAITLLMRSSFCLPTYFSSIISVWSFFFLSSLISSWVLTVYFSSLNIYLYVEERLDNRLIWLGLQSYHLCSLSMVGFCIAFPSWTLQSGGIFIMCCVVAEW